MPMHDTLCAVEITKTLRTPLLVRVYDTLDSTNNEAKRLALSGETADLLLLAEQQTAGRGRLGRSFYSPPGSGLYMTFMLHGVQEYADAMLLTTMAATAVVEAVRSLTPLEPQIKWVNDVYLGGRKACGILTEAITDPATGRLNAVLIGIGINVREAAYPADIADIATHLPIAPVTRNQLAATIANCLTDYMAALPHRPFLETYRAHSLVVGKPILCMVGERRFPATAIGIDDNGGLLIRLSDDTQQTLQGGEISIRLQEQ